VVWEDFEQELDAWQAEVARHGVEVYRHNPYPEPWETQMKVSWEHIFEVEARCSTEKVQATFERLELAQVVKVTEFSSMPERQEC
jgi:hypothetical protein